MDSIVDIIKITGGKLLSPNLSGEFKDSSITMDINVCIIMSLYALPSFIRLDNDIRDDIIKYVIEGEATNGQIIALHRIVIETIDPKNFPGIMKRMLGAAIEKLTVVNETSIRQISLETHEMTIENPGTVVRNIKIGEKIGSGVYGKVERILPIGDLQREFLSGPCAMKTIISDCIDDILAEIVCMTYCMNSLSLIDFDIEHKDNLFTGYILFPELKELRTIMYLPERELLIRIVTAVRNFHSCGFTHGDIKSTNMLVDSAGNVVLIDYGLSRKLVRTITSYPAYAVGYQPVEHLGTMKVFSQGTDMWALGWTIAQLYGYKPTDKINKLVMKYIDSKVVPSEVTRELLSEIKSVVNSITNSYIKKIVEMCLSPENERPTSQQLFNFLMGISS
jgi:hypothetical protein